WVPESCFLTARNSELRKYLGDVVFHGVPSDAEALGDVRVGEPVAQQRENLPLARGEDVRVSRATTSFHLGSNLAAIPRDLHYPPAWLCTRRIAWTRPT